MKMMKAGCLVAGMIMVLLTACNRWIEAPAPMQVDQEDVFSNEQGFRDVLNGVYLQMGSRNLYGRDLSFGLLSVVSRSYDTTISPANGSLYYEGIQLNFDHPDVKGTTKNIWNEMYFSIGGLNNLLDEMEKRKQLFTGNNYQVIKGEALGLRAFLHFELLRLFAPSPAVAGPDANAIPYVTQLVATATPPVNIATYLDHCLSDLGKSVSLLSSGSEATASRFNQYAAKALSARIHLYKGDLDQAQAAAMELINSGKFPLVASNTDPVFTKEHLFSLISYLPIHNSLIKTVLNTNPPLGFSAKNQTALFVSGSGATSDWRRTFNDPATGGLFGNTISPRKFYHANSNLLPMIRMTEMYYIAAECAIAKEDLVAATTLLDTVRVHRNLPVYTLPELTHDSLLVELEKEYQKEFIGEAQMFHYYKRKNTPFTSLPFTKVPVVPGASYVFVKPE